jgi:excinuclease ABC subunit C
VVSQKIKEKLSLVPHTPGCYLMKNSDGTVIYVGKSKNLKNRLTSYFTGVKTGKTGLLVRDIDIFDYILTSSELESLLLEINLIKKYNPKYNILLRDDKSYPYISLTNDKVPRLLIVRNPNLHKSKNIKLFGPYPNVTAARKVVDMLNRIYPLRKCKNMLKKECLYYHIGECLGYCTKNIDADKIQEMRSEIISFLNGNNEFIVKKLKEKMELCAETLQFEKAQEYKELLDYVTVTLEKQKVELDDNINRDVINYYTDNNYMSVAILFIRGGKLLDKKADIFPLVDTVEEELENYISSFYDKHKIRPKELLIPDIIKDNVIEEAFNIKTIVPIKGNKKKILDLAYDNAYNYFNEQLSMVKRDEDRTVGAIKELASILNLPNLSRIELFDNSNLFGNFNVSGMVVFIDGKPCKNEYRKFKITNDKNDDYGTMREVIYRRYFRVLNDNLVKPDLIIVDGGVGQMNVALEVINELYLNIPIAGLKKDDKHSTNELLYNGKSIPIDKSSNLFLLLTRMQDEVHNYTISYHKQIRSKGAITSILDNIEGIGEKRKKELLKKYKTISKMQEASVEDLKEILPEKVAITFKEFLNNYSND